MKQFQLILQVICKIKFTCGSYLSFFKGIAKVKAQNINLTSKEEDVEEEDLDEEEEYRSSRANFSKREIEISYKDYIKK